MIKFKVLAIKIKVDDTYAIFLLKNVRSSITKTISEYLHIEAPT